MGEDRLHQLRRQLASAKTIAAYKTIYNAASALAKEAAAAQDFAMLDECMAVRLTATRNGGVLMLGGADHALGVEDAALWAKRGAMDDAKFEAAVRKVQTLARRRAGESPPPRAAQGRGD